MQKTEDFSCSKCGHGLLIDISKIKPNHDFPNAVCPNCGADVPEAEIRKQARKILDKIVRDAVRKHLP